MRKYLIPILVVIAAVFVSDLGRDQSLGMDKVSSPIFGSVAFASYSQALLSGEINVQAYGAKGDGSDATAGIQAALDLANTNGFANIVIPDTGNDYIITTKLTVYSNTTISGFGSIKLGANVPAFEIANGASNIILRDFRIDGNRTTFTGTANDGVVSPAGGTGVSDILVENLRIENMGGAGILFLAQTGSHSKRIRIIDNYVFNSGTVGIQCQDWVDDTKITGNHVEDFAQGFKDRPGITTGRFAVKHRVVDNYVKCSSTLLPGDTSTHGISIDNANDFVVSLNIVENCNGFGIEIGASQDGSVVGNTISDGNRAHIALVGAEQNTERVSVVGNTSINSGAQGIYVLKGSGTLTKIIPLVGNTIIGAAQIGIHIAEASEDITVALSIIEDSGLSGIHANLSNHLMIHVNKLRNNNALNDGAHAGIRLANAVGETDIDVRNNRVTGSGITDYAFTNPILNPSDPFHDLKADLESPEFSGPIFLAETTTPTPIANFGAIWTTIDNEFFVFDGDGNIHLLHGDAFSEMWVNNPVHAGSPITVSITAEDAFTKIDSFTVVGHEDDLLNVVGSVSTNDLTLSSIAGGEYNISYHGSVTATGGADKKMVLNLGITLAAPKDITNVTDNLVTPIVVTIVGHGFEDGDMVEIVGVLVNTAANGSFFVNNKTDNTFEIVDLDGAATTGNGNYDEGTPTGDVTIEYPGDMIVYITVSGSDLSPVAATGLHILAAGDVLAVYVANLAAGPLTDLTVAAISFDAFRIGD